MNKHRLSWCLIALGIILAFGDLNAQIYATNEAGRIITDYLNNNHFDPFEDTIIVVNHSGGGTASLNLNSPDGATNWSFTWYEYEQTIPGINYSSLLETDIDTDISTVNNLDEGGYAVIYTNGAITDTTFAWLSINNFSSQPFGITYKDSEGKLQPSRYTCDYMELRAEAYTDTFVYYDRINQDTLSFAPSLQVTWSSDPSGMNPSGTISPYTSAEIRNRTYQPPTEDTYYFLNVQDQFGGIIKRDTVFYETIHTKAVLDSIPKWITFPDGSHYYNNEQRETMSAPFSILLSPAESENAYSYVWNFGDGTGDTTYFSSDSILYTYYEPELSPYTISLTTFSEEGCSSVDSSIVIEIPESELNTPPFFTPNGDGRNDYFRVYDVSIRDFEITIFNRWGRVVHKFRGDDIRDWLGWDGNINNSNREAPPGVYYFVIRAEGWDEETYRRPNKEFNGFFHLYK